MKKLLYAGWLCSLGAFGLTVYMNNHYVIKELNSIFWIFSWKYVLFNCVLCFGVVCYFYDL